jgi:hypothetical protein
MYLNHYLCIQFCLNKTISEAASEGGNYPTFISCQHTDCNAKIFPGLNRQRKKKVCIMLYIDSFISFSISNIYLDTYIYIYICIYV